MLPKDTILGYSEVIKLFNYKLYKPFSYKCSLFISTFQVFCCYYKRLLESKDVKTKTGENGLISTKIFVKLHAA